MESTYFVLSLGGSLVVPSQGIDVEFLNQFNVFIRSKVSQGKRFFIVVGGGSTARHYIDSAKKITGTISDWDLDWLGIHTTRLNAHLVRTILQDIAHPRVIANYRKKITTLKEPVVIAAGWEPGWSTDYDAVTLAKDYGANTIINLSNISQVYEKDPSLFPDAKPIHKISWKDFRSMVGDKWAPGANVPFDPIASKMAQQLHLKVFIVNGHDFTNLEKVINGEEFLGTVIS